jgi:hypothetical protein
MLCLLKKLLWLTALKAAGLCLVFQKKEPEIPANSLGIA